MDNPGAGSASGTETASNGARRILLQLQARARHVRPMTSADVEAVVDIHLAGMPGYFLTSLGPRFLKLYYREVINSKLGISLVLDRAGRVLGFVTGEFGPGRFYRRLIVRRGSAFGFYALAAVLRRPGILARMWRQVFERVEATSSAEVARLASLAVVPEAEGRGYGLVLIAAAIDEIRRRGGSAVVLEVREDNPTLIQAYERMGFVITRQTARSTGKSTGESRVEMRYSLDR